MPLFQHLATLIAPLASVPQINISDTDRIIPSIVKAFGIKNFKMDWGDDDYDSIWIILFKNGIGTISFDKLGLIPSTACPGLD